MARLSFLAIVGLLVGLLFLPTHGQDRLSGRVVRVVDGDTICVALEQGREEKVRLIGIDCPEVRSGDRLAGQSARVGVAQKELRDLSRQISQLVEERLLERQVELELDVDQRDRYGRLLAYVWIDGALLNEELVEQGWAMLDTVPPNVRYEADFKAAQSRARSGGKGFWRSEEPAEPVDDERSTVGPSPYLVLLGFVALAGITGAMMVAGRTGARTLEDELEL